MDADDLIRLGNNIRNRRRAQSYSQEGLADSCGLHRTYVCDVERGTRNVTFDTLLKLAKGLNTTVSELTSGIGPNAALKSQVPDIAEAQSSTGLNHTNLTNGALPQSRPMNPQTQI